MTDGPVEIGNIAELLPTGDTSSTPYKVFIGHNLGNRVFLLTVPIHEFFRLSDVANDRSKDGEAVAQRKLDPSHAQKLAVYILKGLVGAAVKRKELHHQNVSEDYLEIRDRLGKQPYISLQPIVTNIRTCNQDGTNLSGYKMLTREEETACYKIMLSQQDVLWVIDGQHRRKAMSLVFEFLETVRSTHKYPKKGNLYSDAAGSDLSPTELQVWQECFEVARSYCTVSVEVHLGLDVEQERQLFHDLNNLSKKVESSLALQFDNSNYVNLFIKEVLLDDILNWEVVEKDIVNWQSDTGAIARKDLVAINAILFLNKTNISGALPDIVEERKDVAIRFWNSVRTIKHLGEPEARMKSVAAQPVVLKALAKLTFDFAFGKRRPDNSDQYLETLLSGIPSLDLSHENPAWRYYELSDAERTELGLDALANYLPSSDEGFNRDIGSFDKGTGVMRFGAKHNDIHPIIGDMIRWMLSLPSRHARTDEEKVTVPIEYQPSNLVS